jgi:hypothetical protein
MPRNEKGQFVSGQSGNPAGRPRGSRHKLCEAFIIDWCADWLAHGARVIALVRKQRPHVYLKVAAALLPKGFEIKQENPFDDVSDEELSQMIAFARKALAMPPQEEAAICIGGEAPALPQP